MKKEGKQSDMPIAVVATLINIQELCFTMSTSIMHECMRNRGFGVFEFSFIRNTFNFILTIPVFFYVGKSLFEDINRETIKPLVIRIVAGNMAFSTFTIVFKLIPLGIGSVIIQSNPFIVVLL